MLRIYPIVLEVIHQLRPVLSAIERKDRDLGRQLRRASASIALNLAEGMYSRGRLPLDNTRAERALRKVVVGRKAWMFYGSDTHAESAATLFTIIATCRLHRVEPEQYLD